MLIHGDSAEVLKTFDNECIDLTVTSPPYDNLRTYNGYTFDFETIAKELYRVTKVGGVVVWVVGDATIKGSETGTSFRQALYFMDCGFNLHDTMIWKKKNSAGIGSLNRYENVFEYMFVFSKNNPKTANIIKDKINVHANELQRGSIRQSNGEIRKTTQYGKKKIESFGRRLNVWDLNPVKSSKERHGHPAPFPEALAHDHILSWSNEGDTVLDCFAGSGTTGKMAKKLNRNFIGIEISEEYIEIAKARIE